MISDAVLFVILTKCTLKFAENLIVGNCFSRLIIHNHLRLFIDFLQEKQEKENNHKYHKNKQLIRNIKHHK